MPPSLLDRARGALVTQPDEFLYLPPQVGRALMPAVGMAIKPRQKHEVIRDFGFDPSQNLEILGTTGFYSNLVIQNENPWVSGSIGVIKDSFSALPLEIVNVKNKADRTPIDEMGSEFDWLQNPGPMSLKEMMQAISYWLDVAGEIFILADRDTPFQTPEILELLPPYAMDDEIGSDGLLEWRYTTPGGRVIAYPTWKIIHLRNYGFRGQTLTGRATVRGVAPSLAILQTLVADKALTKFLKDHLETPLTLSGILKPAVGAKINTEQRELLVENIRNQMQGFSRSQRLLILGSAMELQESAFNPFDIKVKELKELTREEVFAIWGTNEVVMGLATNVKSDLGSREFQKLFYRRTIIPRTDHVVDAFYHQFFQFIFEGRYKLAYDFSEVEALDNTDVNLDRATKALAAGRTPNEVNERYGLGFEEVEWGDQPEPLWRLIEDDPPDDPPPPPPDDEDEDDPPDDPEDDADEDLNSLRLNKPARVRNAIDRFERDFDNLEALINSGMRRIMMAIRGEVLANLEALTENENYYEAVEAVKVKRKELKGLRDEIKGLDEEGYQHTALSGKIEHVTGEIERVCNEIGDSPLFDGEARQAELRRFLAARYATGFQSAQAQLSVEIPNSTISALDTTSLAREFAQNRDDIPETIIENIRKDLSRIVSRGVEAGEGVPVISRNIRDNFNTTLKRARTIARTETGIVLNNARYEMMDREPVTKRHEWSSSIDSLVRPSHQIDGEKRRLGRRFSNGLRFPGDPTAPAAEIINCRCLTLPVVESAEDL